MIRFKKFLTEKKSWKDIIPGWKKSRVSQAAKAHGSKMLQQGSKEYNGNNQKAFSKAMKGLDYKADPIEKRQGKYLTGKKSVKEETITELSNKTLMSYADKAGPDLKKHSQIKSNSSFKKTDNRSSGIKMAYKKYLGKSKIAGTGSK